MEKLVKASHIEVCLIGDCKMKFARVVFWNGSNAYQALE